MRRFFLKSFVMLTILRRSVSRADRFSSRVSASLGNTARNRERPGQQFWLILGLKYIAKQTTCVLTSHVNAVNGITYAFGIVQAFH